jgi:hypothetical protein
MRSIESVPADPDLLAILETIPGLKDRFERVKLGTPVVGTSEYRDRLTSDGELPGVIASKKLAVASDHLLTWNRIVFDGLFLPAWSHLSLLRPVLEASVQARFVIDPTTDSRTRVARALGLAIDDLDWLRKVEATMSATVGWAFSSRHRAAETRMTELQEGAVAHALEPEVRDTVSLMRAYPQFGGDPDVFAWRLTSGILHTQEWAIGTGHEEELDAGVTLAEFKSTADQGLALRMTIAATTHFEAAVADYAAYVEPSSP